MDSGNFTEVPFNPSTIIVPTYTTLIPTPKTTIMPLHTTLIPIPTPTPTSTPPPPNGQTCFQWNIANTVKPCVKVCVSTLNVTVTKGGKPVTTVLVGKNPTAQQIRVSGMCSTQMPNGYNISSITFDWSDLSRKYSLTFTFRLNLKLANGIKHSAVNEWFISGVSLTDDSDSYFSNLTNNATIDATLGHSYACTAPLAINITAKSDTFATLQMSNYTIQPFGSFDAKNNFSPVTNCVQIGMSSYIPIIVGCALAGLVLVLLVLLTLSCVILKCCCKHDRRGYARLIQIKK